MDREDIKLPEEALFEASVLIRDILIGGRTLEHDAAKLNLTTGSKFLIDQRMPTVVSRDTRVNPGFSHVVNADNVSYDGQDLLWVGSSSFVDPARKIAIDRFMYVSFSLRIPPITGSNKTQRAFPESIWESENFIGFDSSLLNIVGTITVDVLFRIDQRHISRLPEFWYPVAIKPDYNPGVSAHIFGPPAHPESDLTIQNDVTLTVGPSTDLYTPNPAVKVPFTINHVSARRFLVVSRTQGRTNAFPVPVFSSYYCGGIPTRSPNYSTLFVRQTIASTMLIGAVLDATKDGDPGVESSITITRGSLTGHIDMDFIVPMPRYTSNGAVNPGVKYDITLLTGAATCYVVDFGGTSRDLIHQALNIPGDPVGSNKRAYLRSFTTLTRGTQATVTITRAMMILFPVRETATSSTFTINYSDKQ